MTDSLPPPTLRSTTLAHLHLRAAINLHSTGEYDIDQFARTTGAVIEQDWEKLETYLVYRDSSTITFAGAEPYALGI